MEELNNELDKIVRIIKESNEYKKCILIKKRMENNPDIVSLIDELKKIQKEYVKSNYDSTFKEKLDYIEKQLYCIPIYVMYNQELNKVNEKINYVRDCLNNYFYKLLNNKES